MFVKVLALVALLNSGDVLVYAFGDMENMTDQQWIDALSQCTELKAHTLEVREDVQSIGCKTTYLYSNYDFTVPGPGG